jgi:phosphoserine phosphatase
VHGARRDGVRVLAWLNEGVAAITERAMQSEDAFEPALRERVALLRGLPESVIPDVCSTTDRRFLLQFPLVVNNTCADEIFLEHAH